MSANRRRNRTSLNVHSQVVGPIEKQMFLDLGFWFQLEVQDSLVPNFMRPEILRHKTDGKRLVPSRLDSLLDLDGFVAIFFQLNFPRSIVGPGNRKRREANGPSVNRYMCAFGLAANDKPALHAARETNGDQTCGQNVRRFSCMHELLKPK